MATIDDKKMIDRMIANNGHYEDDPQLTKIVEYTNLAGVTAWGIVYPDDDPDMYRASAFVQNPRTIWQAK